MNLRYKNVWKGTPFSFYKKRNKKWAGNLFYLLVVASTSSPTPKEKLKLTRSLFAPLVPHSFRVRSSNIG